jgi:phospholipid-binding lipoprotein MlaA
MLLHSAAALSTMPRLADRPHTPPYHGLDSVSIVLELLRRPQKKFAVLLLCCLLPLTGCATPPADPAARAEFDQTNDPLEPLNRKIFDFNQFLNRILLRPVATAYRDVVPEFGRNAIRHFLDNLGEPVVFANNVMQGEFHRAGETAGRFALNSTVGVGGIFDPATPTGLDRQSGDFGQTLYHYGVPDGPYLMLPILGPSNPRDGIGMAVDSFIDPFGYLANAYGARNSATIGRFAGGGIDELSRNLDTLDELQRDSIDFYASLRSLYRQHRAAELRHGAPAPIPGLESLYQDPAQVSQSPPISAQ